MMPKNLRLMFLLHSRTRVHKYRVKKAKERVGEWLSMVDNPYVAFSTGKDSTVILHVVRSIELDVPYVYLDADATYPESEDLLKITTNGIRYLMPVSRLEMVKESGLESSLKKLRIESIRNVTQENGFDGCCYGIRQEESKGRRISGFVNGAIFSSKLYDGVITCQPVFDWKRNDIWAYIVSNDVPYNSYYDNLWDMPEYMQRISHWIGATNIRNGRYAMLKRDHPELYNELAESVDEVTYYT